MSAWQEALILAVQNKRCLRDIFITAHYYLIIIITIRLYYLLLINNHYSYKIFFLDIDNNK